MTTDELRAHVRSWIDEDEKAANVAIDGFLAGCRKEGVLPTFEEYYGSIVQMDDGDLDETPPLKAARFIMLGYVLRGRLDDLLPRQDRNE